ncbi:MAG: bifunctional DNA-formamidopyrimidine glycosylase/DNA-(apurinic or apyrimidinic site) lyase [Microgenomates group bacterium]
MPELPEVETIRRQLEKNIVGKTIKDIEILEKKQFIGKKEEVTGKKIDSIKRYGKVLSIKLIQPIKLIKPIYLNIHLKLTGQLLYAPNLKNPVFSEIIPFTKTNKMPANTTRVIIKFTDGSGLFFNDLRKFGWIKVNHKPEIPKGIDVLSKEFTVNYLTVLIKNSNKPIKTLLMDQDKITGIGNIYANDALFLAKIHPKKKAKNLKEEEIKLLYQSIKKVIEQGIKHGGSSGADEAFVQINGTKGKHQRFFLVYQRENQPCPLCKTSIKRIKQNGRSSFYCPKCQKI